MDVINRTPYSHLTYKARTPAGRVHGVCILHGTFDVPIGGGRPVAATSQPGPVLDPSFYGDPALTSPRLEPDLLPFKPCGEFYLADATAYAPGRRPATGWAVSVRVGPLAREAVVTGPRDWEWGWGRWRLTDPAACTEVPVRYERAFGGIWEEGEENREVCHENPVGCGLVGRRNPMRAKRVPAPQVEAPGDPMTTPGRRHAPHGFGPLHRAWLPRRELLGTVDEGWKRDRWPLLPADFSYGYHNCAPVGQRLPEGQYFRGDEACELTGLTPNGRTAFTLPDAADYHLFVVAGAKVTAHPLVLDTVVLRMAESRLCLTWRATCPAGPSSQPAFIAPLAAATHLFPTTPIRRGPTP